MALVPVNDGSFDFPGLEFYQQAVPVTRGRRRGGRCPVADAAGQRREVVRRKHRPAGRAEGLKGVWAGAFALLAHNVSRLRISRQLNHP